MILSRRAPETVGIVSFKSAMVQCSTGFYRFSQSECLSDGTARHGLQLCKNKEMGYI